MDTPIHQPPTPPTPAGSRCRVCSDTGTMRWQQPTPGPDGRPQLHEMTHPCTCAAAQAAGAWRHPAAEDDRILDGPRRDEQPGPLAQGHARAAQRTQPGLAALLAAAHPHRD